MKAAIMLICLALILYTTAIWSERAKKILKPWMLRIFILAFICDLIGTSLMGLTHPNAKLNIHSCCGILALLIMFIHLLWAFDALARRGHCQVLFSKYSIYAWLMWLTAFLSGVPR
jgi:uncharacterized repeat protein (TIGR03987 family)